jgi:death-on-curing protein
MIEPLWVLRDLVVAVQKMLLAEHGGLSGIRDEALLDSALSRPQNLFAYSDTISIVDLAASYSYGLALNHPFIDGNKRLALTIAAIFLEINGYSLNATEAETVITFEHLASGQLTEKQLASWFKDFTVQNA